MSTPNDIIVAAIARSTQNRANILAAPSEMLRVVSASLRGAFSIAAEVNPEFFAQSADVAYVVPGWARPADAENIFRIEVVGSGECAVVPFDDLGAETSMPAVYALGQIFRPAGNAGDPGAADSLRFFYSRVPAVPANVDAALDASWPTHFDPLLIEDVATYLAIKDGRMDEATTLSQERNRWLVLYVKFLEHEHTNLRRRFGHRKQFNTRSISATFAPYLVSGAADDS